MIIILTRLPSHTSLHLVASFNLKFKTNDYNWVWLDWLIVKLNLKVNSSNQDLITNHPNEQWWRVVVYSDFHVQTSHDYSQST